jgi:hypothetical protein
MLELKSNRDSKESNKEAMQWVVEDTTQALQESPMLKGTVQSPMGMETTLSGRGKMEDGWRIQDDSEHDYI